MSSFLCGRLRNLKPYVPGEQPREKEYIKLNTNESPYPPSPAVSEALAGRPASELRLYPDPDLNDLRAAIAKSYAVPASRVFCGNGSDEILSFAFLAWGSENGAAYPDVSYGFYPVFAALYGIDGRAVPVNERLEIELSRFDGFRGLIVFANPNAPTGLCLPVGKIEALARNNPQSAVLVDEAYVDFGAESALPLIDSCKNLIVVRTFSKSRQLAGARLGFAFAREELIADLNRVKFSFNPYSVNRLTSLAGAAAAADADYFEDCKAKIKATRERLKKELCRLGFIQTDSLANFVFARHPKISGKRFYEALKEKGVLVRHFPAERIRDYIRVTVGTDAETDAFLAAAAEISEEEQ